MILLAHMLTHAVAGVLSVLMLCRYYKVNWIHSIVLYVMGGIAGILPDLFGGRDDVPATHSLTFTVLMIIPIALLSKLIHRKIPFYQYVIVYTVSIWFGHLFFDALDHDMPLLYPFTSESIDYHLITITLGDPFLLCLLILSAILLLIRRWKLVYVLIPLMLCFFYLGTKVVSKEMLKLYISENYIVSDETVVNIYPPHESLIDTKNALEWLQWGYDIFDDKRDVRALVPLIGPFSGGHHVNTFYTETKDFESRCIVMNEFIYDEKQTVICSQYNEYLVFQYDNDWIKVEGKQYDDIITSGK